MTSPNEESLALARRAVDCKAWRWMARMREHHTGATVISGELMAVNGGGFVEEVYPRAPMLPDLEDPATLGCLLALVREAWGNETISVHAEGCRWVVRGDEFVLFTLYGEPHFDSEAHALVGALEAAP